MSFVIAVGALMSALALVPSTADAVSEARMVITSQRYDSVENPGTMELRGSVALTAPTAGRVRIMEIWARGEDGSRRDIAINHGTPGDLAAYTVHAWDLRVQRYELCAVGRVWEQSGESWDTSHCTSGL